MSGPLAGLKVVDAATLYAGPFVSTMLADHGANVIKVEPPGGDPYRHRSLWPVLARNKRSITLDLRSDEGCALLRDLAARVAVLVLNMLPRQLEQRGLTWKRLSAVNPGLVLVCLTGFGLDGPNADLPGSGTLGEAFAGVTHMTGEADGKPTFASLAVGDAITGFVGAFGVLAACFERVRTGRGQVVDVNPVDALLHVAAPALADCVPDAPPPGRLGGRLAGSPVRNTYRCADGSWVAISCSTPRHLAQLLELAGEPDADAEAADAAVAAWIATLLRAEVVARMGARRLPVVPVHDARSLQADPHVIARGSVRTVATPEAGERCVVAPAPRFPAHPAPAPPPCAEVGAHTEQVLCGELGLDPARLRELADEGVV
jgi:crotonobetainyl-CoA:carnitine CoA-transferase CaiB-like acyl-CoA transferase